MWPYQRIVTDLRDRIAAGKLTGQLPSRLKLAEQYGCTHMTVQRAINTLKDEGVLYSVRGLGVFVNRERPAAP